MTEFETDRLVKIFYPTISSKLDELKRPEQKVIHYTRAEVAKDILLNGEIWFRNSRVMNDYSEVLYGLNKFNQALPTQFGGALKHSLDYVFKGLLEEVQQAFEPQIESLVKDTYFSCVSFHAATENYTGRLSMWRAYGDVGIVLNTHPFVAQTNELAVYSTPVNYFSKFDFENELASIGRNIFENQEFLRKQGKQVVAEWLFRFFYNTMLSTKHEAFAEEQELRMFYRPKERVSPAMEERLKVIGGAPQKVQVLKLQDNPDIGMPKADIPSLVDSLILGPTKHPELSREYFIEVLRKANVPNPEKKVIVSDIPLRTS